MNPTTQPAAIDAVLITDGETFFLSAAELVAVMANLGLLATSAIALTSNPLYNEADAAGEETP